MSYVLVALALLMASPAGATPARWQFQLPKGDDPTQLMHLDSMVVAVTRAGYLIGVDAATGKERWRISPDRFGVRMAAASGGHVIASFGNGTQVKALAPRTGKTVWTRKFKGPISSVQACPGYRLAAVTFRGRMPDGAHRLIAQGIDPASGIPAWQTPVAGPLIDAGAGYLFAAARSWVRDTSARIEAVQCETGAVQALARPQRSLSQFLTAGEGHVATGHFDREMDAALLCVTTLKTGAQSCMDFKEFKVPKLHASGGTFVDESLLFAAASLVFRYDLKTRKLVANSGPKLSSGMFAKTGTEVVTGFGHPKHGASASIINPTTLKSTATIQLAAEPRVVAASAKYAFVGDDDGMITALDLPAAGRSPAVKPDKPVKSVPFVEGTVANLEWRISAIVDVATPWPSSSSVIKDLRFLDQKMFAVRGKDDQIAIWTTTHPKRLWQSPPFEFEHKVINIAGCAKRIAAQTVSGKIAIFGLSDSGWRRTVDIQHARGWTLNMTSNCAVVADTPDGTVKVYQPDSAKVAGTFQSKGEVPLRYLTVAGNRMVIPQPDALQMVSMADLSAGPTVESTLTIPVHKHGGRMTQARAAYGDKLLVEYCGLDTCVVELHDSRKPVRTLIFDITGHEWTPKTGSTIRVSPDGETLVFFRRGLNMLLVDVKTNRRQALSTIAGARPQQARVIDADFSPDGSLLAIRGYPESWQATLLHRP